MKSIVNRIAALEAANPPAPMPSHKSRFPDMQSLTEALLAKSVTWCDLDTRDIDTMNAAAELNAHLIRFEARTAERESL